MEFDHSTDTISPDDQPVVTFGGTGGVVIPIGTTAERPATTNGVLRYNTDTGAIDLVIGGAYQAIRGVTSLTPTAVTAVGTTQGAAAPLTATYSNVTASSGNVAVVLPTPIAGQMVTVFNVVGAQILSVFPASGGAIGAAAVNAAYSVPVLGTVVLFATSSTRWEVIGTNAVTTPPGVKYTASATAPVSPVEGDEWLDTDTGTIYTYLTDADSSQWVDLAGATIAPDIIVDSITVTTQMTSQGMLVLPKTTNYGIQVDTTTPTFGWRDLTAAIDVRGLGANDPAWNIFRNGIRAYQFGVNDECWLVYHMPHDWVPGTDLFLHVHWAHVGAAVTSGSVTWSAECTFAKGFDQEAFPATKTIQITQTASTVQYQHMVAEGQLSVAGGSATQLNTSTIEVDGLILCRLSLTADTISPATDPFVFTADIHYQSSNIATKNKAPGFYA